MNERYQGADIPAQLSLAEINLLVTRAMIDGERVEADDVDLHLHDQPVPYFYVLEIEPEIVQAHIDELGRYAEEVVKVVLEYNDPRILDGADTLLPAKLAVFVESVILDELAPRLSYLKDTTYTLYLQPDAQWEVMETYSDTVNATADTLDDVTQVQNTEEKVDSVRKLNNEDAALLRHLI
jgi:hypothetical protein